MPQETKSNTESGHRNDTPGQGAVLEPTTDTEMQLALEVARDYRGDTELELRDGSSLTGFVFDIASDTDSGLVARLDLPEDSERRLVSAADIMRIHLSGRDPAAGRSWEAWVKKYAEKKLSGEAASIDSESLDESTT